MKIRNWFIFIGFLFVCFSIDFIKPSESFADIYRNNGTKPVGEEMRYCLPKKDDQYQPATADLSSISIFGSISEAGAIGIYMGFVAAQTGIVLAILLATGMAVTGLWIPVVAIIATILTAHSLIAGLSVYAMYIAKIITDVLINLFDLITKIFTVGGGTDSLDQFIELLQQVLGLFTPLTGSNAYTQSTNSNAIKDMILATNYYCYNIAGFAESESNPHKLSPYLFKELDILENKYIQYPIYPKKSVIVKGQCSPKPYIEELADKNNKAFAPFESKCSFTFSSDSKNCIKQNIPYIITGTAAKATMKLLCTKTNAFSAVMSIIDTALTVLSTPLSLDTRTLFDYYAISMIGTFYLTSFGFGFTAPKYIAASTPCVVATIAAFVVYIVGEAPLHETVKETKNKAKTAIEYIKFCGQNYYSYNGVTTRKKQDQKNIINKYKKENTTIQNMEEYLLLNSEFGDNPNPLYEYFAKGVGKGSYAYCVRNCMNGVFGSKKECKECFEELKQGYEYAKESIVAEIDEKDIYNKKTTENRIFREWIYEGKEYSSNIELDLVESTNETKYIYDPRIAEEKGFNTLGQRYYMRGNEQANFACDRFRYYKGNGCVLHKDNISSGLYKTDTNRIDSSDFYEISSSKLGNETFNTIKNNFKQECIQAFENAYKYCVNRTNYYVCLEDVSANKNLHRFCRAKEEKEYANNKVTINDNLNLFTMIMDSASDNGTESALISHPNCEISGIKFNIYTKNQDSKSVNSDNYACVFSENLCPYNFRLNGGLNYAASYCDAGFATNTLPIDIDNIEVNQNFDPSFKKTKGSCQNGMFNRETQCSESKKQNYNFNDAFALALAAYDTKGYNEYDYDMISPHEYSTGNVESAASGQLKNYCQFRAHCVKLQNSFENTETNIFASAFMDDSCTGKSSTSRMSYLPVGKRLSSDIAECIYETLSNIVNGKAARNKCKNGVLNSYGYCGEDTGETINAINYEYIKGEVLPDSINPFSKLRKRLRNLVKMACILSLSLWGLKTITLGDFKLDEKKGKALIFNAVKFSIVVTLALNAGWQEGKLSRYLMDFATSAYTFATKILSSAIETKHGTILNNTYKFGIAKITSNGEANIIENGLLNENLINFCYSRSDSMLAQKKENVSIKFDSGIGYDDNGIVCSNLNYQTAFNEENRTLSYGVDIRSSESFNDFMYFIDKLNIKDNTSTYYPALITEQNFTTNLSTSGIWNKHYDGCYFSQNEYPQGKEYLMIFDTMDCKILKYLGLDEATNTTPKILLFVIFCLFLSFIGSILLVMIVGLIFMIINLVIQTIFIFTSSFFIIGILIFVSPVILPLVLFNKTKKIFNNWLNKIIYRVLVVSISLASIVLYIHIIDIVTLQGITFENHNNYGRMPTMNTGKYSDLNYFSVINNPTSFFTVGFVSIFKAISPAVNLNISELSNNKLIIYFFQLGLIYILFKLINDLIGIIEKFTEKIFGDKTKAFDKNRGIRGGLQNSGNNKNNLNGLRKTFQQGGKVARTAAITGVKTGINKAKNSEFASAVKRTDFANKVANSKFGKGMAKIGRGLSTAGRGITRATNAISNLKKEAPIKNFGKAFRSFWAGDKGKALKNFKEDSKNLKNKL